jgi:hypothetical protein
MVKFTGYVGLYRRDPAAFNSSVVRQRFFKEILDRCGRMRQSIKALNRKPVPNMKDITERLRLMSSRYDGLKREIEETTDLLDGIEKKGMIIPDQVKHEVFTVKTILEEILKGFAPPCAGR